MIWTTLPCLLLAVLITGLASCGHHEDGPVIAESYENYFYVDDDRLWIRQRYTQPEARPWTHDYDKSELEWLRYKDKEWEIVATLDSSKIDPLYGEEAWIHELLGFDPAGGTAFLVVYEPLEPIDEYDPSYALSWQVWDLHNASRVHPGESMEMSDDFIALIMTRIHRELQNEVPDHPRVHDFLGKWISTENDFVFELTGNEDHFLLKNDKSPDFIEIIQNIRWEGDVLLYDSFYCSPEDSGGLLSTCKVELSEEGDQLVASTKSWLNGISGYGKSGEFGPSILLNKTKSATTQCE